MARLDVCLKKNTLADKFSGPLLWMLYAPEDAEKNKWYIDEHRRICHSRGWQFEMILTTRLSFAADDGQQTILLDGRPVPKQLCAVISRQRDWQISRAFEKNGCRVFNSSALCRLGNDKWRSLEAVKALGVPVPESCLTDHCHVADNPLGYPVVAKSLDGHGGREVFWAEDRNQLEAAAAGIKGKILLQRPVDTPGRDLRVYVLNDAIIGAVLRRSDTDFRSNYSLGGSVSVHALTREERHMAERIIAMEHMDLAGIDLMYHEGRPVFNEIEDVAGARMLYQCMEFPLVERYVDYIIRCFS